jgi:hypothetical protein
MRVMVAVARPDIPRRISVLVHPVSVMAAVAVIAAGDSDGRHDR